MTTLELWENEATCTIPDCKCETEWNRKIKALIELVRQKDEALKQYAEPFGNQWVNGVRTGVFFGDPTTTAKEAIALTDELK